MKISHRNDLGFWMNEHGLLGIGIEVGVYAGDYSLRLMETWKGRKLYGIDPYVHYPKEVWDDDLNRPDMAQIYEIADCRLKPYMPRYDLLRMPSTLAARHFEDDELDFVYVDGNHGEESVTADLKSWWPRIREGGLLGGHDFDPAFPGVFHTVQRFAKEVGKRLYRSIDPSDSSWWMPK